LFSSRQYQDRQQINASLPEFLQIPETWDPEPEVDWICLQQIFPGPGRLMPAALCYLGHPEPIFQDLDSSGCAAGPTLESAILHGLYELVEREAAAIWWYNRIPRPRIHLGSLDNPHLLLIERHFRRQGKHFYLLDLTHDWRIPAFAAVCHDSLGTQIRFAFGSHADPAQAANQAATELFQVILARGPGSGRQFTIPDSTRIEDLPHLLSSGMVEAPPMWPNSANPFTDCATRADELGLELLWADLTRSDTGLPVVRVIVPGMRPRTPRFAPGRLYETPVRLGWRERVCREEDLNPIPLL
jgi:ribosomal protein S12 methylthiotransferase accessory factor